MIRDADRTNAAPPPRAGGLRRTSSAATRTCDEIAADAARSGRRRLTASARRARRGRPRLRRAAPRRCRCCPSRPRSDRTVPHHCRGRVLGKRAADADFEVVRMRTERPGYRPAPPHHSSRPTEHLVRFLGGVLHGTRQDRARDKRAGDTRSARRAQRGDADSCDAGRYTIRPSAVSP